jgi:electron transport complex protein RnfG
MSSEKINKNVFLAGWLLALTALVGTSMMAIVNWHSKPYIENNERQTLLRTLNSVINPNSYDNDILNDTVKISDQQLLGSKQPAIIYRARKDELPVAAALKVIAPNGYSGEIVMLVGIRYNGQITGVRVLKHRETPGLGDNIEKKRSDWIDGFRGKSSRNPSASGWKVKRDGGHFDQFTGATITPRAVVGAVHKALLFFEKNRNRIFLTT